MVWRSSTTVQDRILSSLPYLMPLLDVAYIITAVPAGFFLFRLFPPLEWLFVPLYAILPFYTMRVGGFLSVELIIFFALFVGVVRNESLPHFLRFNAIQGILMSILLFLCRLVLGFLDDILFVSSLQLFTQGLFMVLFVVTIAASVYGIVQSLRGMYAELPIISEAAYAQVR